MMRVIFKDREDMKHLERIHPNLWYLLGCFVKYASDRNLPVIITSIIRPRLAMSVSDTHAQGRAIDISCRGWPIDQCLEAVDFFKDRYYDIGAISKETKEPAPLVYHKGNEWHFHLQVKP